jgi:hypothetical protein
MKPANQQIIVDANDMRCGRDVFDGKSGVKKLPLLQSWSAVGVFIIGLPLIGHLEGGEGGEKRTRQRPNGRDRKTAIECNPKAISVMT